MCGLALIPMSAIFIGRGYRRYLDLGMAELYGFEKLLIHMEGKLSRYLTPISDMLRDFSDEALENAGFVEAAKNNSLNCAFSQVKKKLAIDKNACEVLEKFFSDFGQGYKEDELRKISAAREELEKIIAFCREELPKNEKTVSALLLAASLGAGILLI